MSRALVRASLAGAAVLLPTLALAHPGHGDASGLAHGFLHPVSGLDHVLAMLAVGLLAAHLGGRALWLVPAAFVGTMALSGAAGMAGIGLPFVEAGIGLSVLVLGLAVALRWSLPTAGAMVLVGIFAAFHGHAHGAEMPAGANALGYAAGFLAATCGLHAIGASFGLGLAQLGERASRRTAQAAGAAMAVAGTGLLAGWL